MKIRLRSRLKDLIAGRVNCGLMTWPHQAYLAMLVAIEGKIMEVDTEHLFQDQFNLKDSKVRVMMWMVDTVIDDIRIGMMRCGWCGKTQHISEVCANEKCQHKSGASEGAVLPRPIYHEVFTKDLKLAGVRTLEGGAYPVKYAYCPS